MITILSNSNQISYGIKRYNADTYEDLMKINTASESMGTTIFVIENSKYYMLNGLKEWVEINPYGTNNNNNPAAPSLLDTIVVQEFSNNIRYRQWSSGFAEMWIQSQIPAEEDKVKITLPFNLITDDSIKTPIVSVSTFETNGLWISNSVNFVSNNEIEIEFFFLTAKEEDQAPINYSIYITGFYK